MSHINKTVSCKAVLAKVARTFKPSDSVWIRDAIEDIGWGIQAIGYHSGFIKKATSYPYITVANYRAIIPCDVERIIHVEYLNPAPPYAGHVLNPDGTTPFPQPNYDENTTCHPNYRGVKLPLGTDTSGYGDSQTTGAQAQGNYYLLNGGYIITSFKEGLIKLHYSAFNTDKEGLPLVIDDFDYKSCLEFYVVSQMILRGMKHPSMEYVTAFQQFETYRLRAENACKVLSLDAAERFAAVWPRYVNNFEWSRDFYIGLEQREFIDR